MTFEQMLQGAEVLSLSGNADVTGLAYDSRQLKPGYVFLAMRPDGNLGRGRYELRKAELILSNEFVV